MARNKTQRKKKGCSFNNKETFSYNVINFPNKIRKKIEKKNKLIELEKINKKLENQLKNKSTDIYILEENIKIKEKQLKSSNKKLKSKNNIIEELNYEIKYLTHNREKCKKRCFKLMQNEELQHKKKETSLQKKVDDLKNTISHLKNNIPNNKKISIFLKNQKDENNSEKIQKAIALLDNIEETEKINQVKKILPPPPYDAHEFVSVVAQQDKEDQLNLNNNYCEIAHYSQGLSANENQDDEGWILGNND